MKKKLVTCAVRFGPAVFSSCLLASSVILRFCVRCVFFPVLRWFQSNLTDAWILRLVCCVGMDGPRRGLLHRLRNCFSVCLPNKPAADLGAPFWLLQQRFLDVLLAVHGIAVHQPVSRGGARGGIDSIPRHNTVQDCCFFVEERERLRGGGRCQARGKSQQQLPLRTLV